METKSIIKQLEKALECKDDKEVRLRLEVLVDMLKDMPAPLRQPVSLPSQSPITPLPTYYETNDSITKTQTPKVVSKKTPQPRGAGAIVSNGEQINYTRPKGT